MEDSIKSGEVKKDIIHATFMDHGTYRCSATNDKETANDQVKIDISKFVNLPKYS